MNKHTKGPWRSGDSFNTVFGPPNGQPCPEIIATVRKGNRANARLITAAPELLECLQFLVAVCETEKDATGIYSANIEKARLAIAKAVQS